MAKWLLLTYRLPREPSAARVSVWRKLKRLGAQLRHDSVWVLPATAATREQMRWLAVDIAERDGESTCWEAQIPDEQAERLLIKQFKAAAEAAYEELLVELKAADADLRSLARRYQDMVAQDYFGSELKVKVREQLASRRGKQS